MNSTGNQSVREVFATALEQKPEERGAYLAGACGSDSELRTLVESLLAAHDQAAVFMPAFEPEADEDTRAVGTEIGCYRLVEQIGEGGFGVVYRAEQVAPFRRQVALKIIKAGMDTKEVISRFEAERQALALMDHPNIARVLEAGATDKGRPYFVMELVEGIPITDYCDQHQLPTEERLKLFTLVCQAVQHAHQKGIIHRDLKPTNILVALHDGEAVPKVIDFGVAKALGLRLTEKTLHTRCEQLIGTPAYMSPEQAELSGTDVDTRADIYSLGVLLYELLTGTTPFEKERLKQAALDEVRRMIRETEPPKPSTRLKTAGRQITEIAQRRHTEPATLNKVVRGDLDWIVMKALAKERHRRYDTATAFALDLERHLRHEPILARPPSTTYRVQKFVRRHRLGVLAGGVVWLALLAGLALALSGFLEARKERDRARAAEKRAEGEAATARLAVDTMRAVNAFLLEDLLGQASPGANQNLTLRMAVDRAAEKVGERFKTNAALEAVVSRTVGDIYWALGESAAAERHFRRVYEISLQQPGPDHESTIHAQMYLARALIDQYQSNPGKVAEAEKMLKGLLETNRVTPGPQHLDTCGILHSLAEACIATDRTVECLKRCEQVLELYSLSGDTNADRMLDTRDLMAKAYLNLGRAAHAEPLQRAVFERLVQRNGRDAPRTLLTLENLGCTLERLGRHAEAEPMFREVVEGRRRNLGPAHPHTMIALRNLAHSYAALADWPRCLESGQEILRIEPEDFGSGSTCLAAWLAGDTNTCGEQLARLIQKFPWTNNLNASKVPALDCLLLAELVPTLEPALQVADAVAQEQPDWPYNRILKALADYRRGRWTAAAEWVQPWQGHSSAALGSRAGYVLSLARQQLGETNAARAELAGANRRFDAFLRAGNLAAFYDEQVAWHDFARLAMLRAEAERVVLGRQVSPPLDADSLRAARERWGPVQQALDRGNYLAGARKWGEARDAFVQALRQPVFDWSVAEACDPNTSLRIGLAFFQAGDAAALEKLCQSVFDRLGRGEAPVPVDIVNPVTLANAALVYWLKPQGRSPELTRRAVTALDWAQKSSVDPGVQAGGVQTWFRLIRGLADYRNGQDAAAAVALAEVEKSRFAGNRGVAKAFRALILQRSNQTDDAQRLLSEAEAILAKSLEDRPYDWRNWQGADVGRLALDEARQTLHREVAP